MIIGRAKCEWCGYVTTTGGIVNHWKECLKNPDNIKRRKVHPIEIPNSELPLHLRKLVEERNAELNKVPEAQASVARDGDSSTSADQQKTLTDNFTDADGRELPNQKSYSELQSERDKWKALAEAAEAYINESPCDPDIYPAQIKAWKNYQTLKQQL